MIPLQGVLRLLLVEALFLGGAGCSREEKQKPAEKPPAPGGAEAKIVSDFDLKIFQGAKNFDFHFIYNGKDELYQPNLTIQTYNDNNSRTTTRKTWATWRPGEIKTVESPVEAGLLEVHLHGGAYLAVPHPGKPQPEKFEVVFCSCRWDCTKVQKTRK